MFPPGYATALQAGPESVGLGKCHLRERPEASTPADRISGPSALPRQVEHSLQEAGMERIRPQAHRAGEIRERPHRSYDPQLALGLLNGPPPMLVVMG